MFHFSLFLASDSRYRFDFSQLASSAWLSSCPKFQDTIQRLSGSQVSEQFALKIRELLAKSRPTVAEQFVARLNAIR